jgi:hypothetical protein
MDSLPAEIRMMLFFLGMLSLLQIAVLPGYSLVLALGLRRSLACTAVITFTLSQLANYFLVIGLTMFGLHTRGAMIALVAVEFLAILWLLRRSSANAEITLQPSAANLFRDWKSHPLFAPRSRNEWSAELTFLVAKVLVVGVAIGALASAGQIFIEWDAVVSWNRWAIDWASNRFPTRTYEYPQLLTSNWSISYVLMQDTSIWFFAKASTALFPLLMVWTLVDLARTLREPGYALGAIITYALLIACLRYRNLSSGYADMPVAFFCCTSIYFLLLARHATEAGSKFRFLLLGAAAAGAAAITKQAGLYIAIIYPILALGAMNIASIPAVPARRLRSTIASALVVVAIVAPWYLYKQWEIRHGADTAHVANLVVLGRQGRSLGEQFVHATGLVIHCIKLPGLLVVVFGTALALRDPMQRRVVLLVALPFTAIWGLKFAYEIRNLAMALPLFGVAAGIGFARFFKLQFGSENHLRSSTVDQAALELSTRARRRLGPTPIVCAGLTSILALSLVITPERLLSRQLELQRKVGDPEINRVLYRYVDTHGLKSDVVTDNISLQWAPIISERYRQCPHDPAQIACCFDDSEVGHIVVHRLNTSPAILDYLDQAVAGGRCELTAATQYYHFYTKTERLACR